jgi:hypothetical protein
MASTAMEKFPGEKQQNSLYGPPEDIRHKQGLLPIQEAARNTKQNNQFEAVRDKPRAPPRPTEALRDKSNSSFKPADVGPDTHAESGFER